MRLTDAQARERAVRAESLLERLDSADEAARALALEALQAVVELYGEALARLAAQVPAATLAADEVVAHVLLLHGLHPIDLEARVTGALQGLRPVLASHGAHAALVSLDEAVAHVAMVGGRGCASTTAALRRTVEEALQRAAPDLAGVQIEATPPAPVLIPAESLRLRAGARGDGAPAPA